jgi:murein L,D-transpeptidase YafK
MKSLTFFICAAVLIVALCFIHLQDGKTFAVPTSTTNSSDIGVGISTTSVTQDRATLPQPLVNPKIVVSKSRRDLTLYSDNKAVRVYRVALGLNPTDDKIRQGDHRTPEGEFYVFTKNDKSSYYLSLGLSYPNKEDAERGLRDKLITRRQYQQIMRAIETRTAPPQQTALGGDIYIHGGGTANDWTWGCVALANEDIRELFNAVPRGATVIIEH